MKKSYLFTSTLIAAVALSVPAWATDYTFSKDSIPSADGITAGGDGSADTPYYITECGSGDRISISTDIFTASGTTVYLGTENLSFGAEGVNSFFASSFTAACNIVIGSAGVYLTNGGSGQYYNFTGTISGDGSLTVGYYGTGNNEGSTVAQHYAFTGDLSGWTGDITITTSNSYDYLIFGGTITGANGNTGDVTGISATQAATNTSVSGTGAISVDYGVVEYVYTAGKNGNAGETLTVTNSSIEAHTVVFGGSVNYTVSSTVTGWDALSGTTSATGSTLTISNTGYTTTFSGSVSNFDNVTVSSGATLAVGNGGSLDLSGATVDLASAIQNSGTVTIDTSTVFVLDNLTPTSGNVTSDEGATYTLITNIDSGSITVNTSSLGLDNVSSVHEITSATFNYTNGVLTVTVVELSDGLHGDGTIDSPYYTSGSSRDGISSTSIFTSEGTVYLATEEHSFGNASEDIFWNGSFTAACDIVIGKAGVYLTNATSGQYYNFTGKISGEGSWTATGEKGSSPAIHYAFAGDLSGWSGDITISSNSTNDYLVFGGTIDGVSNSAVTGVTGVLAVTNTNVSGTGAISVDGTVQYNYVKPEEGNAGYDTVTIGNSSITANSFVFTGSVNYIVSEDTTITSASSSGSFTVSTEGTVTILGTLTTGNANNSFSSLSVAEGSTLRIGATNTFYMDTTSTSGDVFVVSGTLEVAEGVSFTIRKRSAATGYSIANLKLENGSILLLNTYGDNQPGSSGGLSIGTLTVTGSATLKTDSTGGTKHWQNSMSIAALVGENATLNLTSDIASTVANIFELGGSNTESSFTGKIVLSDTASGDGRAVSLVISDAYVASGAVIEMGTEGADKDALALGVNAETVEIAGLVSASGHTGGDIVYSGAISLGATLGDGGATLIDYKSQSGYGDGSNYDGVGTSRNTLVINTAADTEYSFSGVVMDMLNIEKTGAGTQSITFQTSQYGTVGYYFDGTITVKEGTLNLSGVETNSSGITVAKDATLNISNHITLAATSDIESVTSTIAGTLSVTETGSLALSGTVELSSAIQNAGTITIADGASITVGVTMQTGTYNDANYQYYELITGSGSGSVELGSSVTFVIGDDSISLSSIIQRYADSDSWSVWGDGLESGYLVIYGTASTTAQTAENLTWAGTDGNNTWNAGDSSNTIWNDTTSGDSGYYFTSGNNVTFGPNTEGSLSTTIVLGEDITAGTVNITGSGYTLTGSSYTLTATSIVLDDEETGDTHTFTIAEGVKVTAESLEEKAGQLDLVVNGSLEVTTMTVTNEQSESISGSGKLKVGSLTVSTLQGTSLTIAVSEATFGSISIVNHSNYGTSDDSSADGYHSLIIGDGQNETKATVTGNLEMTGGTGEVAVAAGSTLTVQGTLIDSSGFKTSISGDGTLIADALSITANSGNNVQISVANLQVGTFTIGVHSGSGEGDAAVTISSAKFTADSLTYSSKGNLTISSAEAVIGSIESGDTHTLTIADGGKLTTGEIYRSGSTLNLTVNGELYVEKLEAYTGSTGMLYFGKSDSATSMAQTLSGSGTANIYGIEANLNGGSLTISVTSLNIGEGGIAKNGSGTITINGTKVGLYNTNASTISAAITIGANGVTFNPGSGQTLTLSGTVTGNGLVTKTGEGELAFTGTGSSLTKGLTVSAGTVSVADGASLTLGGTVTLASAISNSGTITIADSTSFVINGIEMGNDGSRDYYVLITSNSGTISGTIDIGNFSLTEGSLDGWTLWEAGLTDGYLVIYGEAEAEVSDLTWAGTTNNNTWNTVSENTIWTNDATEESVAFTTGSNVTFDDTAANKNVVLGEDIEAGTVNITGSGYTLTASDTENGNTLTATSIILDDEETDGGAHTFTIGEGVTVTATTLTESAGQLDLVVDGFLNVTESMHIDSSENEVISGSGRIEVKNFTYDAAQGSSLTITVGEFSFSDFVEKPSGEDDADSDEYRTLIIGSEDGVIPASAEYSTEVSGGYAEISGKSEVRVNKNSMFAANSIHNYSDYDLLISGEGLFYANEFDLAGTGKLIISCAEVEAGVVYNSKENIVIEAGGQLAVGDFKHTTIVEDDDEGEVSYTEGLLNLQVDGTFIVDILEDYYGPTGTLSFGTENSDTELTGSHSISGKGTANIYGLEYGADGAGLEISVANLNIGAGGISAADGASSLILDGVTVGVYAGLDEENPNTSWSTGANLTLKNGVTFNTKAGESITLAGAVATDEGSSLTKTGEGTLTLAGEATLSGLTVSGGKLSVDTGASLTLAGNDEVDIQLNGGMLAIAQDATVSSDTGVKTSVTISDGGQLSLGESVSLNVDVMEIVLSTANYDADGTGSGTFALTGNGTLTLTDDATITITVDSAIANLLSSEGTYYFDISDGIALSDSDLNWSALTSYGTVSYNDGILTVFVGAIPEPELFSIFFGISALGMMATRRRRRKVA